MPSSEPVPTSASAKRSAQTRMTAAANTSIDTTAVRRRAVEKRARYRAGPTRWGSSAGLRAMRQV